MDIRKRGRCEFDPIANGGWKRSKPAWLVVPLVRTATSFTMFLVAIKAVAQMMNLAPAPATKTAAGPLPIQNGSAPAAAKTKLCNKYNSAEGCKFNDECHFAHGEWELRKSITHTQEDPHAIGAISGHFGARAEPPVQGVAASFGASGTAKISVDASLAGAIIGKGGVSSKQICRQTGAKLSIREHEETSSLRVDWNKLRMQVQW